MQDGACYLKGTISVADFDVVFVEMKLHLVVLEAVDLNKRGGTFTPLLRVIWSTSFYLKK